MQPDQPLYEEMQRRGSRGCGFWIMGTRLRIAGLLGIGLVFLVWPAVLYLKVADAGLIFALLVLFMAALYMLGSMFRRISYRIALREGIDISAYFEKPEEKKE